MRASVAGVVALLSGAALSLAYPEPDVAPVAWLAIAPLLVVTRGAGWGRGARAGFLFGVGFFGTLLVWISIVGWVAWGLLVFMQALYLALFAGSWGWVSRRLGPAARIFVAGALWAVVELARQSAPVVGFTWGQLAQSQHNVPWLLALAGLGGSFFLATTIVWVNACVAEAYVAWRERRPRVAAASLAAGVVLLALPAALPRASAGGGSVDVAVVQGNVPDLPQGLRKELEIVSSHVRLTRDLTEPVDLVIWPESSVGIDPFKEEGVGEAIAAAARAIGAPLLVGGNRDLSGNDYAVVVFEVSAEGDFVDEYRKTHLVPFGEYVPARELIGGIPMLQQVPRDAIPSDEGKVFDIAGGRVATVISFEGDFGSLVRGRIAQGGRLLVVATNTSTWRRSWASAQHVAFSQVRAAENGVPVVHAALSGISALIAPDGTVLESTELFEATTMTRELAFATAITPYARYGEWPMVGLWAIALAVVVVALARRPRVASLDG